MLTGCAFVVFSTRLCAQNAVRAMHHSRVLDVRTTITTTTTTNAAAATTTTRLQLPLLV